MPADLALIAAGKRERAKKSPKVPDPNTTAPPKLPRPPAPPTAASTLLTESARKDYEYFAAVPLPRHIRLRLTPRQLTTVYYYLSEPNQTKAALRAGYTSVTARTHARTIFAGEGIRSALDYLTGTLADDQAMAKEWKRRKLRALIEAAETPQPVLDRAGKPTGRTVADWASAARSLEILAKIDGDLQQNIAVTHSGEVTHLLRAIADRGKPALEERGKLTLLQRSEKGASSK